MPWRNGSLAGESGIDADDLHTPRLVADASGCRWRTAAAWRLDLRDGLELFDDLLAGSAIRSFQSRLTWFSS